MRNFSYFSFIYYFCDISVKQIDYYKKKGKTRIKLLKFNKYILYCIQKKKKKKEIFKLGAHSDEPTTKCSTGHTRA